MVVIVPVPMALLRIHAVVPRLPLRWRRPEVEARPDEPEEQKRSGDGAEDDARDGTAGEVCAAAAAAGVGYDGDCLDGLAGDEGRRVWRGAGGLWGDDLERPRQAGDI